MHVHAYKGNEDNGYILIPHALTCTLALRYTKKRAMPLIDITAEKKTSKAFMLVERFEPKELQKQNGLLVSLCLHKCNEKERETICTKKDRS